MNESLGIGCPLRSGVLVALSSALKASLRLKSARGIAVDPNRLAPHVQVDNSFADICLKTTHLKGEVRIIIPVGGVLPPDELLQPVEGIAFSLVRVSITYSHVDSVMEAVASEATQLPACPAGEEVWSHFSRYAGGLGYGSLEFDSDCYDDIEKLLNKFKFNEGHVLPYHIPKCSSLDSTLYIIWHWVCASYSMGFGVRLVPPFKDRRNLFSHENVKKTFGSYLIPRQRYNLQGRLLEYLQSDDMILPPGIDKTTYNYDDPDTDLSGYSSEQEQKDDKEVDWTFIEPFLHNLNKVITKYQSIVPSVNGTFLDEAIWITNKSIESSCSRDVVLQLKSSSTWHHGITTEAELVMYSAIYFRKTIQLRAFVMDLQFICLEQLFVNENFDFMSSEADSFVHGVKHYIDDIKRHLNDIGETNAIFDITLCTKTSEIELVNVYALGSLPDGLLPLEDVLHFFYTGVGSSSDPNDGSDTKIIDRVLVAFVGSKTSRSKKHSWCPKDVGELKFNTPDDMIDFLRFQTSKS